MHLQVLFPAISVPLEEEIMGDVLFEGGQVGAADTIYENGIPLFIRLVIAELVAAPTCLVLLWRES